MSIVKRTVVINPIEPAPLSFRGGTKTQTVLDVTYYGQNGIPIAFDVDSQLQLVSRSGSVRTAYSMPAVDIANGKAEAIIPAGDLSDVNGYRAYIYGSVLGEAYLLARGTVFADDIEEPLAEPIDTIDQVPLSFDRSLPGDTILTVKLWDDSGKTDPYDLSAAVVSAQIFAAANRAAKLADFAVTVTGVNIVQISLTAAQVAVLPDGCWWSLRIGSAGGVTTLCEGPVTVTGTQRLPLSYLLHTTVGATSASSDTVATATFKPPDNSLLVVVAGSLVPNGHASPSVITGGGLTFVKQKEQIVTNSGSAWQAGVEIWTAVVATGANMTVSIDFNHTNNDPGGYYEIYVVSFTNYDSVSPVAQVFGDGGTAGRSGAYSTVWPTTPNAGNCIITATGDNCNIGASTANVTEGADFTLIAEVAAPAGFFQSLAQYRMGSSSTTVSMNNFTVPGSFAWAIAGIEIRGQLQS